MGYPKSIAFGPGDVGVFVDAMTANGLADYYGKAELDKMLRVVLGARELHGAAGRIVADRRIRKIKRAITDRELRDRN